MVHFGQQAHHPDSLTNSLERHSHERPSQDVDVEAQAQRDSAASADRNVSSREQILKTLSTDFANVDVLNVPHSPQTHRSATMETRSSMHRRKRVDTNNVSYGAAEMGRATGWQPGSEPGIDTSDPAPPYSSQSAVGHDAVDPTKLQRQCEITCVDYSENDMSMMHLENGNLNEFLAIPTPEWSQVRWINVNGLSYDVIRTLGNHKGLHPLAIEDLMNTRSRTKADWYNDHAFIVLPLQKLVNRRRADDDSDSEDDDSEEDETNDGDQVDDIDGVANHGMSKTKYMNERERREFQERQTRKTRGAIATLWRDIMSPKKRKQRKAQRRGGLQQSKSFNKTQTAPWAPRQVRTLQRWHSGPNQDRITFMERNSMLSRKGLAVSMEQVSIFFCADGTIISFFEYSAQDVETPIVKRLQTPGTILRQSCDASMLVQSILDTIIDLAIPVTIAYQDTLGDLELQVLTDPEIHESKMIYVLTSEIAVLRNAIAPVVQLMSALKDHKAEMTQNPYPQSQSTITPSLIFDNNNTNINNKPQPPPRPEIAPRHRSFFNNTTSSVTISPLTVMYLGDAEDHALLIQDSYDQMRRSADNLVDLIFNTVSAIQNESMKQLTLVTCFFLPLSFMTGYFGMNFETFGAVKNNSDAYFWYIAAPVCVAVVALLLRDSIMRWFGKVATRTLIKRSRKRRLERS